MLTKVFPTGQGRGYGPVEYLCALNPFGKGEREKAPQVISGDPAMIRRQIDAIPFKHKYTSGVHSFAAEDKPTDEQIMEVIEATEELAFAGLPLSSRSILWVKHEHAGRTELHFLIPRQEVNSGKSFNAFPPGWQQKYDPLRDKFNYQYGWARPDDPERARHWQPGINAKILQDVKRQGKPNPKAEVFSLTDDLANMAIQGKFANRSEIESELRRRGYGINRQGKDYLTIVDQNGKKTRLKGSLFEENFNGPSWIKVQLVKIDKPDSEKVLIDQKLAAEADAKLQEAIRKTAQYNINRYSLQENENEQSAGKQPDEKALEQGRTEKAYGVRIASTPGAMAAIKKSADRKADEAITLHSQQGLGKGATNRGGATAREDAQSALREIPLPEQSLSGMGRREGTGSPVERGDREAAEQLYDWSDPGSQRNLEAGERDYRGQPGKPGRYDEVDHGQPERTARQGFQSGKLIQEFRSLQNKTKKLENSLDRISQAVKKLPDIDLDLRPALENIAQISGQVISSLKQANEIRLMKSLIKLRTEIAQIDTSNLLIQADEARKWLREVNEQKLLQKLGRFDEPQILPNLGEFSRQVGMTASNLSNVYRTRILDALSKQPTLLQIVDLGGLAKESKTIIHTLSLITEFQQLKYLQIYPENLEIPTLENLAAQGKITCEFLRNVNDRMIVEKLNQYREPLVIPDISRFVAWGKFVLKRFKSAQQTGILSKIFKAERKRKKIIKECNYHAEWAGSDLRRWNRVWAEYEKSTKKLKILDSLIDEAHSQFLAILVETGKMEEIEKRCAGNPFLKRELAILHNEMENYDAEQNAEWINGETPNQYNSVTNFKM